MAEQTKNTGSEISSFGEIFESLPLDELKQNVTDYISAWSEKAVGGIGDKVSGFIENMGSGDGASGAMGKAAQQGAKKLAEGESPVKAGLSGAATGAKEKVKETFGGGGGSGGSGGGKFTSIIKTIDVGVPLSVAYNQWTQFQDWTDFMKKVESVDQQSEEKINFKGQVFWSHRTWNSTIIQQVADEQIVWRSTGEKGHLDGAVTFHEVAPRLTRIIAIVDYYPQGFMEKTGNIWRAVHRRVKVEMDRYLRQVMTSTILDPDSVEGWRGEIRDSEVVRTHEEVVEDEQAQQESEADEQQDTASSTEETESSSAEDQEETPEEESPQDEEETLEEPAEDEVVEEDSTEEEEARDEEPVAEDEAADDEALEEEEPVAEDEAEPVEEDAEAVEEDAEAVEEPIEEDELVEEEEAPVEDQEKEPSAEEEDPVEDEEAPAEEEETAKSSRSTSKTSPKKRSTSSSKSGSGSKSTRSTSRRKQTKRS